MKDLTNKRFGRWLVLGFTRKASKSPTAETLWMCQCDCGKVKDKVRYSGLTRGRSTSCGCFRKESTSKRFTKVHE
jgi:hypothetical protein